MDIINPATEEKITTIQPDLLPDLQKKYEVLRKTQPLWQAIPLAEREEILNRFVDILKENIESLAHTLTSEMGKPLSQSINEINGACNRILWLTEHCSSYLAEEVMTYTGGLMEKIAYEPLGVVCNISAWNYPYNVGVNVFIPALLAGNTVMYKPSEYATLTGLEIGKLLIQSGVPDGAFQVAVGAGDVGALLLDLPFDGYFFTGSYHTGQYIYQKVASKMVPCQLELGGKDPVYVTDDIEEIPLAVASIADGAFYNNGQSCCAVERIYVHEKIYDEFVREFITEVKSWKVGAPDEKGTYIAVLSRKSQLDLIEHQIQDAIAKGGTVVTGGHRINRKGYYFEPTVVLNTNHTMSLMREESFGPVIGIMKVKNDKEALALMQDTEYGLTASVYSASFDRAQKILSQINSGTAYWNCCDRVSAAVPWSGRKHSGFGVTLSHQGIRAFTKTKAYQMKG
ncbi:MAG: aldehyde dehydrogenase family protein [Saprospiraceae bacterium]|nr:aldehyde dehydrogenase family protein [Saprospiraceae bacterium]